MDIKIIIILVLMLLSYYQYNYPEQSHQKLEPILGKIDTWSWGTNNTTTDGCPATYNPVCGSNNVTYDNICKAALADILEVTPGEC